MGSCIICGASVEGHICESHQEDVYFEFRGTSAASLEPNRFYRGTVDGFADFGVFVDIGDAVTGLLHRSELEGRLENLDWEPGDQVFVQVLDVKDNGNVDLGWSIREREREFRGRLVQTDDGEVLPDEPSETVANDGGAAVEAGAGGGSAPADGDEPEPDEPEPAPAAAEQADPAAEADEPEPAAEPEADDPEPEPTADPTEALERTPISGIEDYVGSVVRLEGKITGVRQTSGPTVFELTDETATVECAAFEEAGVRAYPDVEEGDPARVVGEVEYHHGELQIETEALEVLAGADAEAVEERRRAAVEAEATPDDVALLADHPPVAAVEDGIVAAATAIRRAITETRPVVVRHRQTADGYVGAAAIERATLPLLRERHTRDDAEYHFFERRPLEGPVYDMADATRDVASMLESRDRFGEQLPLVVIVDAGGTVDSLEAVEFLRVYGAEAVVIDDCRADEAVADAVSTAVAPSLAGADVGTVTSTALAANVAAHVNPEVREELTHLPAVSYWEDVPAAYRSLATEAGYDETAVAERREAVALEAYYQSYKDKRELVADLLFDGAEGLVEHVSGQFRAKLADELETAVANLTTAEADGVAVDVLETDAYTHQYDFPPLWLLLDALHRERREERSAPYVTLALGEDAVRLRATEPVDVRDLAASVDERVPAAGVRAVGGRDGRLAHVAGERAAVREATLAALGEHLGRHA